MISRSYSLLFIFRLNIFYEYHLTLILSIQHGQETLENLSKLKPGLVERYEQWAAKHPEYIDDPSLKPAVLLEPVAHAQPTPQPTSRDSGEGQYDPRNQRYAQEEISNLTSSRRDRDREPDRDRDRERDRERDRSREPPRDYYTYTQPPRDSPARSNEEARRAAEEAIRRRTDQIRNSGKMYSSSQYSMEHAGIAQRQQEAEAAAQAARREIATSHAPPNPNTNGIPPVIPALPAPVSASSHQNPVYSAQGQPPPPPPPPMQIPKSYGNIPTTISSSSAINPGSAPQPQQGPFVPYNPYSTSSASASANPPLRRGSNDVDAQRQSDDDVVIPPPPASFPAPIRYSTQHAVSHDPALSTKLTNR